MTATPTPQLQAIQDKHRYERQFRALCEAAGFRMWSDPDAVVASMPPTMDFAIMLAMAHMEDADLRAALVVALWNVADAIEAVDG